MWKALNQYLFNEGIINSITNKLENAKMQNGRKNIKSSGTPIIKEKNTFNFWSYTFSDFSFVK